MAASENTLGDTSITAAAAELPDEKGYGTLSPISA
jgi:hypothetical protein